jgi:1-phosphofructokinase
MDVTAAVGTLPGGADPVPVGPGPGPVTAPAPDVITGGAPRRPRICVVAPTPLLVVEIAAGHEDSGRPNDHADIHLHPGGQGLWVARMAVSLGADVTVCAPFGGELGFAIAQMLSTDQLTIHAVTYSAGNGAYVFDLRGEDRETVAHMPPPALNRHELDDLYGTVLVDALESDVLVVTGAEPAAVVPSTFFGRIVRDLRSAGKPVIADLSATAAKAAAKERPTVLKMSHEEVAAAGLAERDSLDSLRAAAERLVAEGVGAMVVSRAEAPAILVTPDGASRAVGPVVTPLDHRGAGDSMTAGIAVGLGRGLGVADAVRLGAAAGALNVTRRGLGTGRRDQIERFAERISIEEMD